VAKLPRDTEVAELRRRVGARNLRGERGFEGVEATGGWYPLGMSRLYIIGAGGMARECKDLLETLGRPDHVKGFVEEPAERSSEATSSDLHVVDVRDLPRPAPDVRLTCAIGSLRRNRLLDRLEQAGYQFETLVDPRAIIRPSASIGAGSIVM